MYKQRKSLWEGDLLKEGLVIRHLVIPGHIEESRQILSWVKENTPQALISIMLQYQPYFKAKICPEINRRINNTEYEQIKALVEEFGLEGWVQEFSSQEELAGVYFRQDYLENLLR